MALVSEHRLSVVLAVVAAGAHTISSVSKTTGYSLSGIHQAFECLRDRGLIQDCGRDNGHGGGQAKLVELTERGRAAARPGEAGLEKARLNGHRHHANAGLADRIREVLIDGPKTTRQVAQALELPEKTCAQTLQQLATITGGVVAEGPHDNKTFRLFEPGRAKTVPFDPERPFRYAQPIQRGRGAKWGAGLA